MEHRPPEWYKDAIIYEVHVRSFFDSDGDGIGDFPGLIQKLDYLEELGVTALWLLPFYPSPLEDAGYDIADYTDIHPAYGTLEDFDRFMEEAHARGLNVITELVLNHTSAQHPWFQRSRRAPPGSTERDFYVWNDTPDKYEEARVLFPEEKEGNWTWDPVAEAYYWHRFFPHQPDLNFDNPDVREAIFDICDFWFEKGVDGVRLDAITYLYEREGTNCESLPETHQFLKDLRSHIDSKFDNRMLLAEANQWPEDSIEYYGDDDECQMVFHFSLMPRLFMALELQDRYPVVNIMEQTPEIPEGCQWALFLRNHDELTLEMVTDEERDLMYRRFAPEIQMRVNLGIRRRLAPLLDNDWRRIKLLYGLLFSLKGTPIIYYGDEIGMGDNYSLGDRDGVRTPMQWSPTPNAGFSDAPPELLHLPVISEPGYHYKVFNVQTQDQNANSLLNWTRAIIEVRKQHREFSRGETTLLRPNNDHILAFIRKLDDEPILVVLNLSSRLQSVELDVSEYAGHWPVDLIGETEFPQISETFHLSVAPYSFHWFKLKAERTTDNLLELFSTESVPELGIREDWTEVFDKRLKQKFLRAVINYLDAQNWFQHRGRRLKATDIRELIPIERGDGLDYGMLLETRFTNGELDTYVIPVAYIAEEQRGDIEYESPETVICELVGPDGSPAGIIYDAVAHPEFCRQLLRFIAADGQTGAPQGIFHAEQAAPNAVDLESLEKTQVFHEHTETHTLIYFWDEAVLKLFRRLDARTNVAFSLAQLLSESSFSNTPPPLGHIAYYPGRWESLALGILYPYLPTMGSVKQWLLDFVGEHWFDPPQMAGTNFQNYFRSIGELPEIKRLEDVGLTDMDPEAAVGVMFRLGRRTAELHQFLASDGESDILKPQNFGANDRKADFQRIRSNLIRLFRELDRQLPDAPKPVRTAIGGLLGRREEMLDGIKQALEEGSGGKRIQIHSYLHLDQILFDEQNDFVFLNFEGAPGQPGGERRIKRSPLNDTGAMISSIFETIYLATTNVETGNRLPMNVVDTWCNSLESACQAGYLSVPDRHDILPEPKVASTKLLYVYILTDHFHRLEQHLEEPAVISHFASRIHKLIADIVS